MGQHREEPPVHPELPDKLEPRKAVYRDKEGNQDKVARQGKEERPAGGKVALAREPDPLVLLDRQVMEEAQGVEVVERAEVVGPQATATQGPQGKGFSAKADRSFAARTATICR